MAITVDVITKVVDSALNQSGDTIVKHFTRSGEKAGESFSKALSDKAAKSPELQRALDKAADATGKLRVEQEKLNAVNAKSTSTDAQKIAQAERLEKAKREEARAVDAAARSYENANTSARGMLSTLSSLGAGTQFGSFLSSADMVATRFGGIGAASMAAVGGFTALAVGAVAVTKELYDLGAMWDDVSDKITGRTGLIGAELDAVKESVKDVAVSSASSIEEIGDVTGRVVQSMRLSGDELEAMVSQITDLNALTGDQTDIRDLARVYRIFGIEAKDQAGVLDDLYTAWTNTGIPVNELIETMAKAGPTLKQFNMGFADSTALITSLVQSGANYEQTIKALQFATRMFISENRDSATGLVDVITKIKTYYDSGDELLAQQTAIAYFGKRAWTDIYDAITTGGFAVDDFKNQVDDVPKSIEDTRRSTNDLKEEWQQLSNWFKVGFEPIAESVFSGFNDFIEGMAANFILRVGDMKVALQDFANEGFFGPNSVIGRIGQIIRDAFGGDNNAGGGGGSWGGPQKFAASGNRYEPGMVPNNKRLLDAVNEVFPGVKAAADTGRRDSFGEHGSGQALDIMTNPGGALGVKTPQGQITGSQINDWLLKNAAMLGLQYTIWQGKQWNPQRNPDGSWVTSPNSGQGITGGHWDHVHARVRPGPTTGGMRRFTAATGTPTNPATGTGDAGMLNYGPDGANPYGGGYLPAPAGSTPGTNEWGDQGYYLPDERQIDSAERRVEAITERFGDLNDRISDLREKQYELIVELAEVASDPAITEKDKQKNEQKKKQINDQLEDIGDNLVKTNKQIEDLRRDYQYAQEDLTAAKQGNFRPARKAPGSSRAGSPAGLGQVGSPLADDFGLSEGLPGVAKWLTTFAANMAFAPMIGQLSAISAASPYQGGYGLMGMMSAQNMAAGGSPLGLSTSSSVYPSGIGPAPLGGGLGATHAGTGAAPGPIQPGGPGVVSNAPAAGQGGGFQGLGGLPMAAISTAASALDLVQPGAGQAAQIGIQVANRTAALLGQYAGIGVGGVMETLLPHGSPLADPGKSWMGRLAAGFAGARPAIPNQAGTPAGQSAPPQTPEQAQKLAAQNGGGQAAGPMVKVENLNNYAPDGGQTVANQVGRMMMASYASGGPR